MATIPYTPNVATKATSDVVNICIGSGLSRTVPKAITTISIDKIKSVKIADFIYLFLYLKYYQLLILL